MALFKRAEYARRKSLPSLLPTSSVSQRADEDRLNPADEPRWKRHLRTTREGKLFLLVTVGVGVAAFNTGNNLLFLILGFLLSLIVLSGILSEIVIRRLWLKRRLPERCHAGETSLIELSLRNDKKRIPSYSLEVEDLAEDVPTERRCYFLKVAARGEQVAAYRRTPRRRGVIRLSGFRIATRYPFGLFEKWRLIRAPQELLVYPALVEANHLLPRSMGMGAETTHRKLGRGVDIAEIRAYRDGDEARMIHWRRTAALGQVVVLERHAEAGARLSIALDNARPVDADASWERGFEHAVSQAAFLAVQGVSRGQTTDILVRSMRSVRVEGGQSPEPLLRFLALLQAVDLAEAGNLAETPRGSSTITVPVMPLRVDA